jgi:small conductance mechanosensitive channel
VDDNSNTQWLRDLFGNPEGGSFLEWFADHGVWAILIAVVALIALYLVRRYIRSKLISAVRSVEGYETSTDGSSTRGAAMRGADRFLATILPTLIIGTAAVVGILLVLGRDVDPALDFFGGLGTDIALWLVTSGLKIVVVIIAGWVGLKLSQRFIPALMLKVIRDSRDAADHAEASRKRAETLGAVFVAAINVIIVVVVVFTVLTELTVPIGPVIGGVGIAGIAVGFGAQHLVRDVITGTLILLENQYRQGDVVQIAGIAGLVESINLRRTVLRDLEGKVHTIPHGEITTTSNFTKYWSRIVLDVGVAYKENMKHVFEVLNDIGTELGNHPELGLKVIDPPKVLRLNSFDDSQITIRMLGVCKPLTQWELAGWMRVRVKERFDEEGIEIPFPHQSIYWGVDQPQLPWQQPASIGDGTADTPPTGTKAPEALPDDFEDPTQLTPGEE